MSDDISKVKMQRNDSRKAIREVVEFLHEIDTSLDEPDFGAYEDGHCSLVDLVKSTFERLSVK